MIPKSGGKYHRLIFSAKNRDELLHDMKKVGYPIESRDL